MSTNGIYHDALLVGEVIESSTTDVLAQACQLDAAPALGSFVRVSGGDGGPSVYAVVAHVQTAGIDPGARAVMRGHGEVRDDMIYRENPDLPLVLRTTFRCALVGFEADASVCQLLPPTPPRLHYSVYVATAAEVRRFTDAGINDALDAAYRTKYRRYASYVPPMISPEARATTLKLVPHGETVRL